ncbi:MAG: hypothetical protein R2932_12950 [Caldilineaceae bacterium]
MIWAIGVTSGNLDALNGPSQAAAQQLGILLRRTFSPNGDLQGAQRDGLVRHDRPGLAGDQRAFNHWLEPVTLMKGGEQRVALSTLTGPLLVARG